MTPTWRRIHSATAIPKHRADREASIPARDRAVTVPVVNDRMDDRTVMAASVAARDRVVAVDLCVAHVPVVAAKVAPEAVNPAASPAAFRALPESRNPS